MSREPWTIDTAAGRLEVLGPFKRLGTIVAVSAREQEEWARANDARKPTAAEFDQIWLTADIRVPPKPRDVVTAPLDALHGDFLAEWAAQGSPPEPRICLGKTWVSDGETAQRAANYGWFVRADEVRGATWRGIKVYPTTLASARAIQPVGHAHDHGHRDYSQIGYAVRVPASERITRPELEPPPQTPPPLDGGNATPANEPAASAGKPRSGGGGIPDAPASWRRWPPPSKLGDRGQTVAAWQQRLKTEATRRNDRLLDPGKVDGAHGPKTEVATSRAFAIFPELAEYRRQLYGEDRATSPGPPPSGPGRELSSVPAANPLSIDALVDRLIPAKNFRHGRIAPIRLVILHSTENPIRRGVAMNVARWFGSPGAPMASAHFVVDRDEIIRCVADADTAFAAPGANHDGIQIELVGQALRTDWSRVGDDDAAGQAVMLRAARLVGALCRQHRIPVARVDAAGLLAGDSGITTHAAVSRAYKKSTHVDPGGASDSRWPWEEFLDLVAVGSA